MSKCHAHVAHMAKHMNMVRSPGRPLKPLHLQIGFAKIAWFLYAPESKFLLSTELKNCTF